MKPIQAILIFLLIIMVSVFIRGFRKSMYLKPIMIIISLFGMYLIISPKTADKISYIMGVDEAADLMFYIFSIVISIIVAYMAAKIKMLHNMITRLYRENAILEAKKYGEKE
jgi:hypothetical protein